jgi:hypothetical protein
MQAGSLRSIDMSDKMTEYLFNPGKAKIVGMASKPAASALDQGWWPLLRNIRWADNLVPYVRNGTADRNATGLLSQGTFRGAAAMQLFGGTPFTFAAYKAPGLNPIQVYYSVTGTGFSQLTTASGQYGDTRFPYRDKYLTYQVVVDRELGDEFVIVQNGVDFPRVIDMAALTMAVHEPVEPATSSNLLKTAPTWPVYFAVNDNTATVSPFGSSGVGLTLSENNVAAPNNLLTLQATNVQTNATATVTFTTAKNFENCRQLILIVESNYLYWLDNLKIELGNSSGFASSAVWDGTGNTFSQFAVPLDSTGKRLCLVFTLDHIASELASVDRMKLTWVGANQSSFSQNMKIYAICGSGQVSGQCQHGISYANFTSRAESVGQVISTVEPDKMRDVGGTALNEQRIPNDYRIYYDYKIQYQNTSETERDKGVDKLRIYRRDPTLIVDQNGQERLAIERKFTFVRVETIASWGGSTWDFIGASSALDVRIATDSTPSTEKNLLLELPDAFHMGIPIGRAMHYANGRLFVSMKTGTSGQSKLAISEFQNPFRFREAAEFENGRAVITSAATNSFDGEMIMAFASVTGEVLDSNSIYVFTNQNTYKIAGVDITNLSTPTRIASIGTRSPGSIAEYKGAVYFLDSDMQVRRLMGYQMDDLSRYDVDDKLQGIPADRRELVSGAFFRDRYYLAYTPQGGTLNSRCLVFNHFAGKWESDDAFPGVATGEQLLLQFDNGTKGSRLNMFSTYASPTEPKVYEYSRWH